MSDYREILARKILGKQDEVEKNQLTIQDLERRIEMSEEAIIRFKIENDILMEEINFLNKRRKENE
jgi:septal ring factor EnvC (AmiA/AmiB activator)